MRAKMMRAMLRQNMALPPFWGKAVGALRLASWSRGDEQRIARAVLDCSSFTSCCGSISTAAERFLLSEEQEEQRREPIPAMDRAVARLFPSLSKAMDYAIAGLGWEEPFRLAVEAGETSVDRAEGKELVHGNLPTEKVEKIIEALRGPDYGDPTILPYVWREVWQQGKFPRYHSVLDGIRNFYPELLALGGNVPLAEATGWVLDACMIHVDTVPWEGKPTVRFPDRALGEEARVMLRRLAGPLHNDGVVKLVMSALADRGYPVENPEVRELIMK